MRETTLYMRRRNNLFSLDLECPFCSDKYVYGVPYVHVPCKKCGSTYKTEFKQSMYTKIAGRLQTQLAWFDRVNMESDEDFYSDIATIEKNYKLMKNWDVGDVSNCQEDLRYCESCGTCHDCFTCRDCRASFKPNKNMRKQRCPECGSKEFMKTYFDKIEEKGKCPRCKSTKIKMTLSRLKTQCHRCKGKKLSRPIRKCIYKLTITRKKSYMVDQ